ncbi:hypothetical protein LNW72_34300 [Streptomyces sp. RKAG293]|nr:hypothetical protein [Streptomyces sp. RKAG293]MCM2423017.1 hypothetical protein [Streptomyces sp. RKAG293]
MAITWRRWARAASWDTTGPTTSNSTAVVMFDDTDRRKHEYGADQEPDAQGTLLGTGLLDQCAAGLDQDVCR